MKINFYLMGEKGLVSLDHFLRKYGSKSVAAVITARDPAVDNDYFDEIESLCAEYQVNFQPRSKIASTVDGQLYAVAIGWRWMIPDSAKLIVFHDSILPKYRGFAPLVNMLINGEPSIGVTALMASQEYDKGNILGQKAVDIAYPIKIQQAIELIAPLYGQLLIEVFGRLLDNQVLSGEVQDESLATYSLWRDEADYLVNWNKSAAEIKRFCDAVGYPYKGACTRTSSGLIRLLDVQVVANVNIESRADHIGKVIFMDHNDPVFVCADGLLKLTEYKFIDENEDAKSKKLKFRTRVL